MESKQERAFRLPEVADSPAVEIEDDSNDEEILDEDLIDAGVASAALIADPKSWINRRVETVEMLSQEETRRRVSIDFTLSKEQRAELTTRHGMIVPISVLSKRPRRNFDLRDERAASLPVLGRNDNGNLALIALLSAALGVIDDTLPEDPLDVLAGEFRGIVFAQDELARDALGSFVASARAGDAIRSAVWNDVSCRSLLRTPASDYVLFAALPTDGPARRILKYGYGDELRLEPPWSRPMDKYAPSELWWRACNPGSSRFLIDCPGAWRASSFHMEIAIPEELRVAYAELGRDDVDLGIEMLGPPDLMANRAALYAAKEIAPHDDVRAYVEVVSEREGGTTRAALTAVAVATLLWLGWVSGLDASQPGAGVSLLLAGGAVLSGFAAARGRHILVNKILRGRRRALTVVALCALAASATLAMEWPSRHPLTVWLVAAIVCSVAALHLGWSAVRAAR